MDGWINEWMLGWMDAGMHGQRDWMGMVDGSMENGQMNRWMDVDGWKMDRVMDGWMDGWME